MSHNAEHLPFLFTRQLVVGFMLLLPSAWAAAGNVAVKGSVVDDAGKPVANAGVLISYAAPADRIRSAPPPVITGRLAAIAKSDSNGDFSVSQLAPGEYIACAEGAPGYLDPCHWSAAAPSFTMTAGQTISGMKIVMPKGAVLQVHIVDPQQLLKPVTGPVDFDFELHVITGKGLHHGAPIRSSTPGARDHAITIPFGTPVTLRVLSAHLAVSDQSGKPFASAGTTINIPAGSTPGTVGLTIVGKK